MKYLVLPLVAVLLLAGCSASPHPVGRISIVASTDVYGSIARAIGGGLADVTSVIDDPTQDPHSFEGSARVQLELSKADVIIENGAGYDDFMHTMLASTDNRTAKVLNVADISGKPITKDFNEHLWYDFPTVENLVAELVAALSAVSPDEADAFEGNAERFIERLASLEQREATLKERFEGTPVAITEPVPSYLLEASGLKIVTPVAFSRAIEEGTDVAPGVLHDMLALFPEGKAALLVYNKQTMGPQTDAVLAAARDARVGVIPVTETLPFGEDYLQWMGGILLSIERILR